MSPFPTCDTPRISCHPHLEGEPCRHLPCLLTIDGEPGTSLPCRLFAAYFHRAFPFTRPVAPTPPILLVRVPPTPPVAPLPPPPWASPRQDSRSCIRCGALLSCHLTMNGSRASSGTTSVQFSLRWTTARSQLQNTEGEYSVDPSVARNSL